MPRIGPLHTLSAGVLVALALGLFGRADPATVDRSEPAGPPPAVSSTRTPAPVRTQTPEQAPATPQRATYAARVEGSRAFLGLAIRGDKAIAYVCDGRRLEVWLRGSAKNGLLALYGAKGARLVGTHGDGAAFGAVRLGSGMLAFDARTVAKPSGLYRATGVVRGAKLVGGWIVLPNRRQVGIVKVGDKSAPAPELDPAAGAVTVDGTRVVVNPADPTLP